MLAHMTIYISAIRLRVNEPDLERPLKVGLQTPAFIAMCAVPITLAVSAMSPWGNGWDYFIWGAVAALTGPATERPPASGVSRRARRRRGPSAASGRSTSTSAA
jgi:amino acid transporter